MRKQVEPKQRNGKTPPVAVSKKLKFDATKLYKAVKEKKAEKLKKAAKAKAVEETVTEEPAMSPVDAVAMVIDQAIRIHRDAVSNNVNVDQGVLSMLEGQMQLQRLTLEALLSIWATLRQSAANSSAT